MLNPREGMSQPLICPGRVSRDRSAFTGLKIQIITLYSGSFGSGVDEERS